MCGVRRYPQYNASNASALWLHDDTGRPVELGHGGPRGSNTSHVYDFCNADMLEFYKSVILSAFMTSPDVHGSFFDETDSFVEGGGGNHPWKAAPPAGTAAYVFSDQRKANLTECWIKAMETIVEFMADGGKFAIPSSNAYQKQYVPTPGNIIYM